MSIPKRYRFSVYMNEEQMKQLDLLRMLVDPENRESRSAILQATVRWALDYFTRREGNETIFSSSERV